MTPRRHWMIGTRFRKVGMLLALLLVASALTTVSAQPTKDGQPQVTPPPAVPAPAVAPQTSAPAVTSPPAAAPARNRALPGGASQAKLQRNNRQLAANLANAQSQVRTLQATNESLAREVNTLRRELLDTGQRLLTAIGLALGLLLLPPLLYLLLIQRRLQHLRDVQNEMAREHERQLQDQEALLRSLRGTFQRQETREIREGQAL